MLHWDFKTEANAQFLLSLCGNLLFPHRRGQRKALKCESEAANKTFSCHLIKTCKTNLFIEHPNPI